MTTPFFVDASTGLIECLSSMMCRHRLWRKESGHIGLQPFTQTVAPTLPTAPRTQSRTLALTPSLPQTGALTPSSPASLTLTLTTPATVAFDIGGLLADKHPQCRAATSVHCRRNP